VHDSGQNIQVPYGNLNNGTGIITGGWHNGESWKTWYIKPIQTPSAQTYRIVNAGSATRPMSSRTIRITAADNWFWNRVPRFMQ
jgi:hypothetical protein